MGLVKYKTKRNFKKSPEPTGGVPKGDRLRFVIQKHDASHLHYDFRLELDGVLKSWAVPKGPTTDPAVKRLAMMVEDHPYDYRNFEGIIPSGYGAGTVIIWDEGFYEPNESDASGKKSQEKDLRKQLVAGRLKFTLHGKKLRGKFALIKMSGRGDNEWLLIKDRDEFASKEDILLKDKSVISKKTIAQMAKAGIKQSKYSTAEKNTSPKTRLDKKSPAKRGGTRSSTAKKTSSKKKVISGNVEKSLHDAPAGRFTTKLSPMLATLVDQPFNKDGWIYEIKWDGYRAMAFMNKGKVELRSRNDKSFNEKFYPVYAALEEWQTNAIVDGEVVVLNKQGISDFGALQNWRSEADGDLLYYVFDIVWLDGKDLRQLPLGERHDILKSIVPGNSVVRLSETFEGSGIEFFEAAKKAGLEGMIAKRSDSTYHAALRTGDWLKVKSNKRQEVVIGGFTINEDTSKPFSSLLVGTFKGKELVYTGKIGTGFSIQAQKELLEKFKHLITKNPPFRIVPDVNKPSRFRPNPPHASVVFLKPRLVCEVSFTEMTSDGVMRHPSFEGMRIDKASKDVHSEKEQETEKLIDHPKLPADKPKFLKTKKDPEKKLILPPAQNTGKTLLNPSDETQVKKINGHELKFTNLNKIYWPDVKVTKRDMLNYYYKVAPYILPYLKDRPQSMNRHPNGIDGESFFYKDVTGKAPGWVETFLYHSDADNRDRHYLVAKDEASLLYMASLGCIEMNPWSSRVQKEDHPDWCVIDLDPGKTTFEQVISAAQVTRKVLDELGVPSYPKTSGSTGMHIYIPLGAKYTYEQSKEFARAIVTIVNGQIPEFTSIVRTVNERKGKMYLDFLQNRPQATISAPYSLRPKPGATVSMPLHWDEVKKGLKMNDFTIFNALERIRSNGDVFKPVLGKGIDLRKVLRSFSIHE